MTSLRQNLRKKVSLFRIQKMKIYLLKGHERPITQVKFNVDGDLLFSSSRDYHVSVWRTENGERLGSYSGHNGAVLSVDVNGIYFQNHKEITHQS
jgi:WD40 repeat protein